MIRLQRAVAILPVAALLTASAPASAATIRKTADHVALEGETYRLRLSRPRGTFTFSARDANGDWQELIAEDGEDFWYGFNARGAEMGTHQHTPRFTIEQRNGFVLLKTICTVSEDLGAVHRAAYLPVDNWVLCRSQFVCERPSEDLGLVRLAPRGNVSVQRFTHYALRDRSGDLRQGALAELGDPVKYVGVRPWSGAGDVAADLDDQRPYVALYNPQTGATAAFIYPLYKRYWADKSIFVQLFTGGRNYLYAGWGRRGALGGEFPFCIYADSTGGIEQLEMALPRILRRVRQLIDAEVVPIEAVSRYNRVRAELGKIEGELKRLWGELESAEHTPQLVRRLWLSRRLWRQAHLALEAQKFDVSRELATRACELVTPQEP